MPLLDKGWSTGSFLDGSNVASVKILFEYNYHLRTRNFYLGKTKTVLSKRFEKLTQNLVNSIL